MKVARRPSSTSVNPDEYLPCRFCHEFFAEGELYRHAKTCPENNSTQTTNRRMKYDAMLLLSGNELPSGASQELSEHVLSVMVNDDVTAIVKTDKLILLVGSNLMDKRGHEKAVEVS